LVKVAYQGTGLILCYHKQGLIKFNRLGVIDQDINNGATYFRFNLVKQLHRFNDADRLALLDPVSHLDKGLFVRAS
jgi:hypothetical protein